MLPPYINSWTSTIRAYQKCHGQTLRKKNLENKWKRKTFTWEYLNCIITGNSMVLWERKKKKLLESESLLMKSPSCSGDTYKRWNLGSACPYLLRRSVFAELSLKCLSVCIAHHPYNLITICLTPCQGSSFAFSFGPGAYTAQKCPGGLRPDHLMTVTQLTEVHTFCTVGGTWLKITYSIPEK